MTTTEILARLDTKFRQIIVRMPPKLAVKFYSSTRLLFLKRFYADRPERKISLPEKFSREFWGIKFQSPLFNSAGMFKNGEGYQLVARQGAGAFLCGTTTAIQRTGNKKDGITQPFAPYPDSGAASNWLGLPNYGHAEVAKKISRLNKIPACPIGVSVSSLPEQKGREALESLVQGMKQYESANADFLELNESCPNIPHGDHALNHSALDKSLIERLEFVQKNFLLTRKRNFPVIVKFSNDTDPALLPDLLDLLTTLGFDGVNFGNTSTKYKNFREKISSAEQPIYDYFTATFGGGLSGRILKKNSLGLASEAKKIVSKKNFHQEFHVIRTGGIENFSDIQESEKAGIELNQWYTGYFEAFAHHGHELYGKIFSE